MAEFADRIGAAETAARESAERTETVTPERVVQRWFAEKGGVFLNPGSSYGTGGGGYMRMNPGFPASHRSESFRQHGSGSGRGLRQPNGAGIGTRVLHHTAAKAAEAWRKIAMKRSTTTAWSAAAAVALVLAAMVAPPSAQAQFDDVGVITFPTSATGEAQDHFLRGVAILHSFGWKQAREQFHAAQAIDPDFALAYWGESLAYNHPLVTDMDPTEPREALQRLAPTAEERIAKAPTEREKGLMRAVEILWGEGDHSKRRVEYMEAMGDLHDAYPDDPEIAAFYALSLLGAARATGDLSERFNIRAGTIALKLLYDNPVHPGAAHYTIHSFDHPINAPLALEAAYAFADIAPAVSHARHMPTHIFIQHGMWDLVSGHNQSAYDVARELWQPGDALGDAVHSLDWGQYGDLQRGDYAKARVWIERIAAMVEHEGFEAGGARGAAGTAPRPGRAAASQGTLRRRDRGVGRSADHGGVPWPRAAGDRDQRGPHG